MKFLPISCGLGLVLLLAGPAAAEPLAGIALAEVTGSVVGNSATAVGPLSATNTLDQAYQGAVGISVVQQNNGDNNFLGAAVSVIESPETMTGLGAATSSTVLNTVVSGNSSAFTSINGIPVLTNIISGAFNGASGVMLIQQNNGNNNVISAAISVASSGTAFSFGQVQQISAAATASGRVDLDEGGASGALPPGGLLSLGPGH